MILFPRANPKPTDDKTPIPMRYYGFEDDNPTHFPFKLQHRLVGFILSTVQEACFYFVKN